MSLRAANKKIKVLEDELVGGGGGESHCCAVERKATEHGSHERRRSSSKSFVAAREPSLFRRFEGPLGWIERGIIVSFVSRPLDRVDFVVS